MHRSLLAAATVCLSLSAFCQQGTTSPTGSGTTAPPNRIRQTPILGGLGVSCQKANVGVYGNITFFQRHAGVAYGVSTHTLTIDPDGEDLRVYLWLSNLSNQPIEVMMCCGVPLLNAIQVVDASGKRLVSGWERYNKKTKSDPQVCTCSADEIIPPGSCTVVDSGVLNASVPSGYSMPPGTYTIMEDPQPSHALPDGPVYPVMPPKSERLTITIAPETAPPTK
jgi:hypothetical protein